MRKPKNTKIFPKDWEKRTSIVNHFLKDINNYLQITGIEKRLKKGEIIPAKEIKKILHDNFEGYFRGEVDQKFILGLAWKIYEMCHADIEGPEIGQILNVVCPLQDLEIEIMKWGKTKNSPEEIDQLIHRLFEDNLK